MLRIVTCLVVAWSCSLSTADETKRELKVGSPAPDFTVTGIDGKQFKLSDKLKSGKKNVALMFSRANW